MQLRTHVIILCFGRFVPLEILKQLWFSFHITQKPRQHTHVQMLCLVIGSSECFGIILTGTKTIMYVIVFFYLSNSGKV